MLRSCYNGTKLFGLARRAITMLGEMNRMTAEPFSFDYKRTSESAFKEVFHAHLEMEFTYIHEGVGNLIVEGRTYPIGPGTLMVFHPFQLHRVQIHVTAERPFIRSVIMFDPALLTPYWETFPLLKSFFASLKQHAKAARPIRMLDEADPALLWMKSFHEARRTILPAEKQEEWMFFLLGLMRQLRRAELAKREEPDEQTTLSARHPHRAEQIMQWIERHYAEPFRLEQMAKELHLSRYHIAHLFKEATGTTILAYVTATRIRHACLLLTTTSLTVPEIGLRAGLPNPSYFCRVFKETMGTTPHQYRLNIQKSRA
ncbi:AraC family transcriptional regulator [Paenibacillus doosanensis]|nr:AraC family transcriptional regulator [Paenibacillus doosanensis]